MFCCELLTARLTAGVTVPYACQFLFCCQFESIQADVKICLPMLAYITQGCTADIHWCQNIC